MFDVQTHDMLDDGEFSVVRWREHLSVDELPPRSGRLSSTFKSSDVMYLDARLTSYQQRE